MNNVIESVRRMICSVKENVHLSQCYIGNVLIGFLSCSPGERHLDVFFLLFMIDFFFFEAGKPSQPKNVHIHP